jgi:hypothetical protein
MMDHSEPRARWLSEESSGHALMHERTKTKRMQLSLDRQIGFTTSTSTGSKFKLQR